MRARRRVKGVIRANAISEEGATQCRGHKLTSPPVESTLLSVDIDEAGHPYQGLAGGFAGPRRKRRRRLCWLLAKGDQGRPRPRCRAGGRRRPSPVIVDERTMTVIDGVHRLEAYRSLGRSRIPAIQRQRHGGIGPRHPSEHSARQTAKPERAPGGGTGSPTPLPRPLRPVGGGGLRSLALHGGPCCAGLVRQKRR